MITRFDDFCIHQTHRPVAEPSQSDRNFYDRYWFNGVDSVGHEWLFEVGFGLYPNRRVMDGHFSVTIGDKQYAFHASRRAPKQRDETVIGPLSVTIEEPMRRVRVRLEPNEHNIECDLLFTAASVPHEEPVSHIMEDGHLILHTTRFTQMGRWQGYFGVDGKRIDVDQATGIRDKSWGVRPVGEPAGGAPAAGTSEPGVYWVWNPVDYGDFCTQMASFENREGKPTQLSADLIPLYQNPADIPWEPESGAIAMKDIQHTMDYVKGTRRPSAIHMTMTDENGKSYAVEMKPTQRFYMLGIGYNHNRWGHAMWQGELETGREEWDLNDIDELVVPFMHVHQIVKSVMTDSDGQRHEGVGTFESIIIGRHARSGFKDFFDGAQ